MARSISVSQRFEDLKKEIHAFCVSAGKNLVTIDTLKRDFRYVDSSVSKSRSPNAKESGKASQLMFPNCENGFRA